MKTIKELEPQRGARQEIERENKHPLDVLFGEWKPEEKFILFIVFMIVCIVGFIITKI